jgi:hypothetical protein
MTHRKSAHKGLSYALIERIRPHADLIVVEMDPLAPHGNMNKQCKRQIDGSSRLLYRFFQDRALSRDVCPIKQTISH